MEKQVCDSLLPKPNAVDQSLFSKLSITIFSLQILGCAAYTVIAPFMPLEFARRGIHEDWTGYIFGTFSIPLIFGSPLMSTVI